MSEQINTLKNQTKEEMKMSEQNNLMNELKALADKLNISLRELFLPLHLNEEVVVHEYLDFLIRLRVPVEDLCDAFGDDAVRTYFDNMLGDRSYKEFVISFYAKGEFPKGLEHYFPALKSLYSVTDEEIEAERQRRREKEEKQKQPKRSKRNLFGFFWGC